MDVGEKGLARGLHFVIGLTVLSVAYAGVLLTAKFLVDTLQY